MNTTTQVPVQLDYAKAAERLKKIVNRTPLTFNQSLSRKYQCNVYLKREDLQVVRSYKLRGAYNMMSSLPPEQLQKGAVCASAGNHAQGFAYSCKKLNVKGVVFMPIITPNQKVQQTKMFGEDFVEVVLTGDTFDDCAVAAKKYTAERIQFGKPIASFQLQQKKLAEMLTEITKAQLLNWRLGVLMNEGKATTPQISMAKRNSVQVALEIAREARQMHGGMGITGEYPIMRHMMNLESVVTYEGTHDIHLLILGNEITGIPAFV